MQTRPLGRSDLDGAPPWFCSIELRPDRWRDEHTRSVIALEGDTAVAAGILWTSRVHGDRYWVKVVVDPERRRQGIGTAVVAALADLRALPLPWQARGFVGTDELAFADALGARTVQVVPPMQVAVTNRDALRPVLGQTRSGAEVGIAALGAAWTRLYEWTHASWAPTGPGFAAALLEDFADEVDLEATSVTLTEEGEVSALTVVFDDGVLCGETTEPDTRDGERLVESCLHRSLDVLAARGVEQVELDGHVSDPHWFPAWIRLSPTGDWFRIVEITP